MNVVGLVCFLLVFIGGSWAVWHYRHACNDEPLFDLEFYELSAWDRVTLDDASWSDDSVERTLEEIRSL